MKKFFAAIIIVIIVTLGILIISRQSKPLFTPKVGSNLTPTPVKIPFDYIVKNISPSGIVLSGKKGDLILPVNTSIKVFKGTGNTRPASLTDIKKGQKIVVKLIPGQSAFLYILK